MMTRLTLLATSNVRNRLSLFSGFFFFFLTLLPITTTTAQILYCPYCPVNWKDTIAPHAECQTAVTAYLDTAGYKYLSPIVYDNFSTDNCPVIIISASQTRFYCADVGTKNVILYVRDTAGNRAQCTTRVTIIDTIRPKLLKCAKDTTLTLSATECGKAFTFATPTVTDNCATTLTTTQSAGLASGSTFPIGATTVTFTSKDPGNNIVSCSFRVTVNDIPPTVTCKPKFAPRINSASTRLSVSPFDVAATLSDNCTPLSTTNVKIRRAGSGTGFPDSSALTFGCKDTGRIAVEIWAKDQSGLTSSCTTTIYVNDSSNICRQPIVPALLGQVATEEGKAITAKIAISSPAMPLTTQNSAATGFFAFANLVRNGDYRVTPERGNDWINGITTFDVALISRHVLNTQPITSPYKMIAADVNRDGSIDALDILITRRVALRQMDSFPNNRSWRFVPKAYVFPAGIEPILITFPEFLVYTNVTDTVFNADFVAIKTGDLNNTATNSALIPLVEPRGAQSFVMEAENPFLEAGKTYNIAIRTPRLHPEAFQFTLNYDKNSLKINALEALDLNDFSTSNYAHFADRGKITVSWNSSGSNAKPMNLFVLKLQATRSTRLSDVLHLSSDLTPAEAYSSAGDRMAIDLRFKGADTDPQGFLWKGGDFSLFQNDPNPFRSTTNFRFRLPEESDAKLTVFDATGRILKVQNGHFNKGINDMTLDFQDTPAASGILFYRLDTPTHSATQRMMLLN